MIKNNDIHNKNNNNKQPQQLQNDTTRVGNNRLIRNVPKHRQAFKALDGHYPHRLIVLSFYSFSVHSLFPAERPVVLSWFLFHIFIIISPSRETEMCSQAEQEKIYIYVYKAVNKHSLALRN